MCQTGPNQLKANAESSRGQKGWQKEVLSGINVNIPFATFHALDKGDVGIPGGRDTGNASNRMMGFLTLAKREGGEKVFSGLTAN